MNTESRQKLLYSFMDGKCRFFSIKVLWPCASEHVWKSSFLQFENCMFPLDHSCIILSYSPKPDLNFNFQHESLSTLQSMI